MKPLPVFQLAETELRPGTTLIEASAGTGKTYTIAGLFLRLILERDLPVRQILVVTYTVAATEELRNRIRQTLAAAWSAFDRRATNDPFLRALLDRYADRAPDMALRLRRALDTFDEAAIYTIHAFCQRVLKDRAFETGSFFDTELVTDQMPLLRQVVEDYWRTRFYPAGRLPVVVALSEGLSPHGLLPLVRDTLSRPFLRLLAPVQGQSAESLAAELERVFGELQEVWRTEKAEIRSLFGSSARWANKPYNDDDTVTEYFRLLDACLGPPEFPPSALHALRCFCSSAIAEKVNKVRKLPPPSHRFFGLCDEISEAIERYVLGVKLDAVEYVRRELPRRKDELKVLFYDDLLSRIHAALTGGAGEALAATLREHYQAALIDEFQDTDPMQYAIFRRVFTGPESLLFLIGDPKQAIYGFRGADIFTYLTASDQATQGYTLRENWRSEASLVQSVNTVFGVSPQPFVFPRIRFQPVEAKGEADKESLTEDGRRAPAFQIWFETGSGRAINKGAAEIQLAAAVASEIVRLLNGPSAFGGRKLLPEDIAVLVPVNRQAQMVQQALAERSVPSVLYTDASLFRSSEVLETQRVLAAVADPTQEPQLLAALATDLIGYTGARLEALTAQESEREGILARFRDYLDLWSEKGFIQMFRSLLQREQVRARLLAFPDGERRLTNLLHLSEVLHRASVENRLGIAGLLKWLAEQRDAEGPAAEEHQLRLETDEKAVKLVTIHKSKGLEYPVVFCPYSWRGVKIEYGGEEQVFFHDQTDFALTRDLGGPDYDAHRQLARVECLAENVRQFYVALTRARHRCYLAWGPYKDAATSAPAWLLHPPPQTDLASDPVTALEEHFPKLDDSRLLADLNALAEKASTEPPAISVSDIPVPTMDAFAPDRSAGPAADCRKFTGAISRDWRVSSFTSLTANRGEEQPDYDELGAPAPAEAPASGIFAFPSGAKPGTCLHKILELLDFAQWNQPAAADLVQQQLVVHGLPDAEFADVIVAMLGHVMTVPLDERVPDLTLEKIGSGQRLNELEFYFPLQKIAPQMISRLLHEQRFFSTAAPGVREPKPFDFSPVRGMLKGFMDLVFEFAGRFYLVDWKSNLLGSRIEDYSAGALAEEIRRQHYYFQYQLYTVALDRYLRLRVPGYRYEQHFGGVFYVFLRGIDPARPQYGIHRDRLPEPLVRALGNLLIGGSAKEDTAHG